jgi:hypothetical protein
MRILALTLLIITPLFGFTQLIKNTSLQATGTIDVILKGLFMNEVGAGIGFDALFFSKHKLQAIIETNADYFVGDKFLVWDTLSGKQAKSAKVYSIKAGPQFFVSKRIAISATYGPSWHTARSINYSITGDFKYSVTAYLGPKKCFIIKLFLLNILAERTIQYIGFSVGRRF